MGYSTTYLGRLRIEPALNEAEAEWLRAYAMTHRPGGDEASQAVDGPSSAPAQGGSVKALLDILTG